MQRTAAACIHTETIKKEGSFAVVAAAAVACQCNYDIQRIICCSPSEQGVGMQLHCDECIIIHTIMRQLRGDVPPCRNTPQQVCNTAFPDRDCCIPQLRHNKTKRCTSALFKAHAPAVDGAQVAGVPHRAHWVGSSQRLLDVRLHGCDRVHVLLVC